MLASAETKNTQILAHAQLLEEEVHCLRIGIKAKDRAFLFLTLYNIPIGRHARAGKPAILGSVRPKY